MKSLQTQIFSKFSDISSVLVDKELSPEHKLTLIDYLLKENEAERRQIRDEVEKLTIETGQMQDEKDFYAILESKSLSLQKRAADIIRSMQIDPNNISSNLFEALQHFQNKDGNIQKNAPKDFLSIKEKNFLQTDNEKFPVSLYKVLLFQKVAEGIKAGTVNFANSHKYRSLDDYLIPQSVWKIEFKELLYKADLEKFVNSAEILKNLTDEISRSYKRTNRNIDNGKNSFIKFKRDDSWTLVTPKQDKETEHLLKTFFPNNKVVSLSEVLSIVNRATSYLDSFNHLKTTRSHSKPSPHIFLAGIIALGSELGISKIANISKHLKQRQLENTYNWYFSLENLHAANKKILDFLNSLELPNLYRQHNDLLHTSSDGQKYAVSVPSLNANFSYKYFGQKKGVSVYSFIDERNLLFYSTVIS
jgi:hypothetical protein